MSQNPIKIWIMAIRPKTLGAAIAPVCIGSALAYAAGGFQGLTALSAGISSLFIQIGTNLANDYFDYKQGKDTSERLGPVRVTQAGLVSPQTVKNAMIIAFGLAVLFGIYVMIQGGWPLILIGILSILSGIAYTGGPFPLGYNGLGDLFVFIFFGPVAVGGTFYTQTHTLPLLVLISSIGPGALATGLLAINNIRDRHEDKKTGKKTLAVRFGRTAMLVEYTLCMMISVLLPSITHQLYLISLILLIPAIALSINAYKSEGKEYNACLAKTGLFLLFYSLIFSLSIVILK